MSVFKVILVRIFPYSDWVTPNTDIFYTVDMFDDFSVCLLCTYVAVKKDAKKEFIHKLKFSNRSSILTSIKLRLSDMSVFHRQFLITYFLCISKVSSMLHHGSVGQVHSKECYFMFTYTFWHFFVVFYQNICVFVLSIYLFDRYLIININRISTN